MRENDVIEAVIKKSGVKTTKKDMQKILDAYVETIRDELCDVDGKFTIPGFGAFVLHRREAKPARNPRTGEKIDVPAHYTIKFKPSAQLKKDANSVGEL